MFWVPGRPLQGLPQHDCPGVGVDTGVPPCTPPPKGPSALPFRKTGLVCKGVWCARLCLFSFIPCTPENSGVQDCACFPLSLAHQSFFQDSILTPLRAQPTRAPRGHRHAGSRSTPPSHPKPPRPSNKIQTRNQPPKFYQTSIPTAQKIAPNL